MGPTGHVGLPGVQGPKGDNGVAGEVGLPGSTGAPVSILTIYPHLVINNKFLHLPGSIR